MTLTLFSQDIAVLTDNTERCEFYETESFNMKPRGICRGQDFNGETDVGERPFSPDNNQEDCEREVKEDGTANGE